MANILITGFGGITPQNIARSLKLNGDDYRIIATDMDRYCIGLYLSELIDKSYVVPPASDDSYLDRIKQIIEEEEIDLLICSPEKELLDVSRHREEFNCKLFIPDDRIIRTVVNKSATFEVLEQWGCSVPKGYRLNDRADLRFAFDELGGELWIRADEGTSGEGSLKVDDFAAAKSWIDARNGWGQFSAAQYLPGRNLACKVLFHEGKLIAAFVAERLRYLMAKVAPSGITGNVSLGKFVYDPKTTEVSLKALNSLFEHFKVRPHGMFTVDLKENDGGMPFITEINPRHIATTHIFASAGMNFSKWMVKLALGEEVEDVPALELFKDEPVYFMRHCDTLPVLVPERDILEAN